MVDNISHEVLRSVMDLRPIQDVVLARTQCSQDWF